MSFDLLIKNACLQDGRSGIDVACAKGMIVAVKPNIDAQATQVIDAQGQLLSPPLVDPHFHMDATLSLGQPRMNISGTLLEGIALWGELKPKQSVDDIIDRAMRYCDLAVSMGIGAIRSHVDVCDDQLKSVTALLEVRRLIAPYIDLQLVAFPQDGLLRDASAQANLIRALDMGVDVVGGIPHFERTMQAGTDSIKILCELAAERGLRVDMHCDESDDPHSRHIETLASETLRLGLQGRVAGSHLTSMHSMDNYYVSKLLPLIAEAGVHAIPNPLINIMLQARHDSYPKRRGQTRVPELKAAGVNVGFGSDCMMDPWYSMGAADMLDVASMGLHVGQLSSRADMAWCFDAVTYNSAAIMGLQNYGIAEGCQANMVLLQATNPVEAIRLKATRLTVIRHAKVIAQTPASLTQLTLPGRPTQLDPARTLV
jgi:cytosine deaminase